MSALFLVFLDQVAGYGAGLVDYEAVLILDDIWEPDDKHVPQCRGAVRKVGWPQSLTACVRLLPRSTGMIPKSSGRGK